MSTLKLDVDMSMLKAALHCAAIKDIRSYLNAVCLEVHPEHTFIMATDGAQALILKSPNGPGLADGSQYLIPASALEGFKVNKKSPMGVLKVNGRDFILEHDGRMVKGRLEDGTYPPIRRVIPKSVSREMAHYSHKIFDKFLKAGKELGVGTMNITITPNGDGAGLVALREDAFGIIMPVREKNLIRLHDAPSWFN